jgi:hypothetical protein
LNNFLFLAVHKTKNYSLTDKKRRAGTKVVFVPAEAASTNLNSKPIAKWLYFLTPRCAVEIK